MAVCGLLTPKTVSLALHPAPTRNPIPMLWLLHAEEHDFHQCCPESGRQYSMVGRHGQESSQKRRGLEGRALGWRRPATEKGAHPNCRFTAPAKNCPCISPEFDKPQGVPISAIVFGGRRAKTAPLVYQSRSWQHGVFVGSIMASETTAAATGAVGVVRRDPMAMLPFCGYHMGDYLAALAGYGATSLPQSCPKSSMSTGSAPMKKAHFLWPGFGDNLRVLEWILKRCFDEVDAQETPIGYEPNPDRHQSGGHRCLSGDPHRSAQRG